MASDPDTIKKPNSVNPAKQPDLYLSKISLLEKAAKDSWIFALICYGENIAFYFNVEPHASVHSYVFDIANFFFKNYLESYEFYNPAIKSYPQRHSEKQQYKLFKKELEPLKTSILKNYNLIIKLISENPNSFQDEPVDIPNITPILLLSPLCLFNLLTRQQIPINSEQVNQSHISELCQQEIIHHWHHFKPQISRLAQQLESLSDEIQAKVKQDSYDTDFPKLGTNS